jgi:hypothetical protein
MKTTFQVLVALALAARAAIAAAQSVQEGAGLSAAQRDQLEQRTCQAWHVRRIAAFRTEELPTQDLLRVSFECEPHQQFRNLPLAAVGYCDGRNQDWKCESVGLQLDLGTADAPRPVLMIDVSPEKAVELHDFIAAQARKGRRIRSGILEGHLTLLTVDDGDNYVATFEFSDHANSLLINARCGKRGCRYKLHDVQSYATYRNL